MSEIEDKLLQSTRDVNGMEIEGQERSGDIESMKSRKLRLSVKVCSAYRHFVANRNLGKTQQ